MQCRGWRGGGGGVGGGGAMRTGGKVEGRDTKASSCVHLKYRTVVCVVQCGMGHKEFTCLHAPQSHVVQCGMGHTEFTCLHAPQSHVVQCGMGHTEFTLLHAPQSHVVQCGMGHKEINLSACTTVPRGTVWYGT